MAIDYTVPRVKPEDIVGDRCDGDNFRCIKLFCDHSTFAYCCAKYSIRLKLDNKSRGMPAIRTKACLCDADKAK